jgi:hypothetical protein
MTSPTTPRDAIAGLSERLREEAMQLSGRSLDRGCVDSGIASNLADEAADQLDALSARVKELEAECFRLAADTCHAGYGDEYGHHRCREVDEANARATRAERERDTLSRVMEDTARELGCASDNEVILESIARLGQERDEAYERAAKVAEEWRPDGAGICIPRISPFDHKTGIAAAIRQLASGPDKEMTIASD